MFKVLDFSKQILSGKTIYRAIFNQMVGNFCSGLSGEVLDLAGGSGPSYVSYLPRNVKRVVTDYEKRPRIDFVADINKTLPISSGKYNNVLFFNAIYIAEDPVFSLREIRRVLRDGGKVFLSSPFISNEMPEPHDYRRLTKEGLEKVFTEAGFNNFEIVRFGGRFTSSVYLIDPVLRPRVVKMIVCLISIFLDNLADKISKNKYPAPMGFFCVLIK